MAAFLLLAANALLLVHADHEFEELAETARETELTSGYPGGMIDPKAPSFKCSMTVTSFDYSMSRTSFESVDIQVGARRQLAHEATSCSRVSLCVREGSNAV